ncbi:dynein light chain 4, axonemal-like [Octopus sinensis]|uniref:Dynein light chain n=1 Tax=Octopus sinensis TaxID=2607531 RepID=A0A7E6EMT7_9MOLL|nr:dynein light chain 4, axonemal-like [Octopus sinensis]
MAEPTEKKEAEQKAALPGYALVKYSDMVPEMKTETLELVIVACEKFVDNNELAARSIKEAMDKKFKGRWHVVVGEGFGFEITYELHKLLYLFFGGNLAILIWNM